MTNPGTVYNLRPTGDEPARVGIVVEGGGGGLLPKVFLQAPVFVRPGPDGYGLESTFADQPREAGGIPIQITKIALTFNGEASKGHFMRMPTSCAQGTSLSRANSWEAPTVFSEKTFGDDADGLRLAAVSQRRRRARWARREITKAGRFPPGHHDAEVRP